MMADQQPDLHYNAAGTHVFVRHTETGGEWECPVGYLDVAILRGWVPTEPPAEDLGDLFDDPVTAPTYASRLKAELEAAIAARNADRGEDDQIVPHAPGNKTDLIAALEADDQAQLDSTAGE